MYFYVTDLMLSVVLLQCLSRAVTEAPREPSKELGGDTADPREHIKLLDSDHDTGNKKMNSTFLQNIQDAVVVRDTGEDSTTNELGDDLHLVHDTTSTLMPGRSENQTLINEGKNHDPALEKIIKFDVCEPCRGASKCIIVI